MSQVKHWCGLRGKLYNKCQPHVEETQQHAKQLKQLLTSKPIPGDTSYKVEDVSDKLGRSIGKVFEYVADALNDTPDIVQALQLMPGFTSQPLQ